MMPHDQRDCMTADTERGGHRGQGSRSDPAIHGALTNPDDQRAIVIGDLGVPLKPLVN